MGRYPKYYDEIEGLKISEQVAVKAVNSFTQYWN
jgi:hypothetical protein